MNGHSKPFAAICLAMVAGLSVGCSNDMPEELLDSSSVMEFADISEEATLLPHGVGGFKLKKEMHRNGGWIEQDTRLLILMYKDPLDDSVDNSDSFRALNEWTGRDEERLVRFWIDGDPIDLGFVKKGSPGKVTASDLARYCSQIYFNQHR